MVAAVASGACAGHCGARGGLPPKALPPIVGPDGREYVVHGRGPYKAFYDSAGHLARLEYDSNGDGRADQIALHDGRKVPHEIDVDVDFDGKIDRWEEYDPSGRMVRLGLSRRGNGRPDMWTSLDAQGRPTRKDYDEDADGKPDRWEYLGADGRVERVEIDTLRDGRLVSEDLDTDGDGCADRRLQYGADGRVSALEIIPH